MTDNLFKEDEATKAMILEISSLMQVKADIVRNVWQFTVLSMMLRVAETDENKLTRLVLPYIGSIGIKNNGTIATTKGMEQDLDVFMSLSENFKNMFNKCQGGNYADLSEYVQKKFLDPVINNILVSQ